MEIDPAKIDPKHLKISYLPRKEEMSRRDLLFGLLKPHYEIVPAVEKERCLAWRGCSLCVASCPQEAISINDESAAIDKQRCTACGACLTSCRDQAISSPLLNPEVLDVSLQSLLCRDEMDLEPRVLLITSGDACTSLKTERGSVLPQLLELKLPCIGALSPWLLLRSLDLGADSVAVIPCTSNCRHRCEPERWLRAVRFVQSLLAKLGMERERVRTFPFSGEQPQTYVECLRAFVEQLREFGPSALCNGKEKVKRLDLVTLLKDLGERFNLDGTCLTGDEVPFGAVRIDLGDSSCTLCGACPDSCPTGAITLKEGAGLSQLLFDHSRCVACGACVKVCPEQVLQMERMLDFSGLGVKTILAEDRMAHCRNCGKEIAPLAMMRKIRDQLGRKKGDTPVGLAEFCPDCRIFGSPRSEAR
jgi:ferredoxin